MALAYDFDIFELIPDSGPTDPKLDGFLADAGFRPRRDAATVALFRDPRTAQALRHAPPGLRNFFLESGFGLNTFESGAPPGRYPASDEAARLALIARLTQNACLHRLPRPDDSAEGGDVFRLGEFLSHLDRSEPIDMTQGAAPDCDAGTGPILSRDRGLPAVFETDPIPDAHPEPSPAAPRRKFWQSRFFRLGAAAALLLGAMQVAGVPSLTALASL